MTGSSARRRITTGASPHARREHASRGSQAALVSTRRRDPRASFLDEAVDHLSHALVLRQVIRRLALPLPQLDYGLSKVWLEN